VNERLASPPRTIGDRSRKPTQGAAVEVLTIISTTFQVLNKYYFRKAFTNKQGACQKSQIGTNCFKLSHSSEIGVNFGSAKSIFGEILMRRWSSVRQGVAATVLLLVTSAAITSLTSNPAYANACPLTQGFWKNHPAAWGVDSAGLTIGGQSYTQAELLTILQTPPSGGNASLILAHQLIAAQLNFDTGSVFTPDPSGLTRNDANSLLMACGTTPLPGCFVAASSPLGQQMVNDAATLDAFNSGTLTPICTPR
jgi:hypothetical protein